MTTLPITVLAYEGPMARAYLARMKQQGWTPERIILLVLTEHPATRKPIGRLLPGFVRTRFAAKSQDIIQNYWPRRIADSYPELVEAMARGMESLCPGATTLLTGLYTSFRYEEHGAHVEYLLTRNLRDSVVVEALRNVAPQTVIFTGGGIVSPGLLELEGIRWIHVHPGFLPHVRGGDGFLWSLLVRGRPGVSAFYMARGIDTGAIIAAAEFPPVQFDLSGRPRPDDQTLYRAIFSFCDPILRAHFLATRVLGEHVDDGSRLPTTDQDESEGVTYHFMHPTMRSVALSKVFCGTPATEAFQ